MISIFLRGDIDFFFAAISIFLRRDIEFFFAAISISSLPACDVYALVAATANRELETKNVSLAGDVYALVGRDRRWRAGK